MRKRNSKKLSGYSSLVVFIASVFLTAFIDVNEKKDYSSVIKESRDLISETMTKEKIPGLAIAVIDENSVVWTEGFGYTDLDQKLPITPETMFGIQSMSKTITATAAMMAVQDGMIDLDKPISTYVPNFTVHSRFDDKPQDRITIRHLLSHTAGFTMEAPVGNNCYPESPSFEKHAQSISETWLRYPVGQRYSYSNLGVDLAGYILQIRSGKTFADYVKEKLLGPIGMKNSSFDMDVITQNQNRAIGHSMYCKNVPLEIPMIPSGGFYTSASDLAKFVQFHLNGGMVDGKSLLGVKYHEEMYRIPFPLSGQYEGYALGIEKVWNDKYHVFYYNHNGGGFGFLCSMTWYPDYGIGIVILTNSDNNSIQYKLSNQITDLFLKLKEPKNTPAPSSIKMENESFSGDLSGLRKYAGRYLGRGQELNVTVNNQILFVFNGGDSSAAKFVSPTECRIGNDYYRFMAADQTPAYVVRINDGTTWDYNDGPNDRPDSAKDERKNYVGTYTAQLWGQIPIPTKIFLKNGYLYLTDNLGFENKLSEYRTGIFFTATGECVDFSGNTPMFANILVKKAG